MNDALSKPFTFSNTNAFGRSSRTAFNDYEATIEITDVKIICLINTSRMFI